MFGLTFFACSHHMIGVLDHFARFGFLAALQIGVAQEVHGVGLIVRFGEVHFRGMRAGSVCGNVRSDRILPQAKAHEDMRRHVQGVGRIRGNGRVPAGSIEALRHEFRAIGRVNHVMRDSRMIGILLQQGLENRDGSFLVREHVGFVGVRKRNERKRIEGADLHVARGLSV